MRATTLDRVFLIAYMTPGAYIAWASVDCARSGMYPLATSGNALLHVLLWLPLVLPAMGFALGGSAVLSRTVLLLCSIGWTAIALTDAAWPLGEEVIRIESPSVVPAGMILVSVLSGACMFHLLTRR